MKGSSQPWTLFCFRCSPFQAHPCYLCPSPPTLVAYHFMHRYLLQFHIPPGWMDHTRLPRFHTLRLSTATTHHDFGLDTVTITTTTTHVLGSVEPFYIHTTHTHTSSGPLHGSRSHTTHILRLDTHLLHHTRLLLVTPHVCVVCVPFPTCIHTGWIHSLPPTTVGLFTWIVLFTLHSHYLPHTLLWLILFSVHIPHHHATFDTHM